MQLRYIRTGAMGLLSAEKRVQVQKILQHGDKATIEKRSSSGRDGGCIGSPDC